MDKYQSLAFWRRGLQNAPMPGVPHSKIKILLTTTCVGIALSLISIFFFDQPVARFFSNPDFETFRLRARDITNIGEGLYWFALAFLGLGISAWCLRQGPKKNPSSPRLTWAENLRNASLYFLASLVVSGVLLQVVKMLVGRQRPHLSETFDPLVFSPLNWHWHWQSYPSGHTQTLVCVAMNLSLAAPRWRYLIFALTVALVLTRVIILQHFLGDVIAGATMGWLGTCISFLWLQRKIPLPAPLWPSKPR